MVDVLSAPSLYEFTGGSPPTLAELEDRYGRQVAGPPRAREQWHNWIVRRDGDAVGFVQATTYTGRWTADVAWLITPGAQGQGYATEAAAAVVHHLMESGDV